MLAVRALDALLETLTLSQAPVQAAIAAWLAPHKPPTNLRLSVDIDPQSFL